MKLRRPLIALSVAWLLAWPPCAVRAQDQAAPVSSTEFQADRERIAAQRKALDARFLREEAACYQRFAVQDCLQDSRRRRRVETDTLKRQEATINDIERKRRGAQQLKSIEQRQATPRTQDQPDQQEQARRAQHEREQQAAGHARSRAAMAAEVPQHRRDLDNKQRDRAEHRAKAASLAAQAPAERERFDRKQQSAQKRRAERAKRNADRSKPAAAPLPVPPP